MLVIFAPNMHQKLCFRAPNAKLYLPWEGDTPLPHTPLPDPPPLGRFAPSQIIFEDMEI